MSSTLIVPIHLQAIGMILITSRGKPLPGTLLFLKGGNPMS